ncbi:MAG: 3-oxoacyl-ACP synthase III [Chitinophagaceae bacterium]|nr:3-oxoacyl-ACP synthase III [Oligoflexus sp.]
MRYQNVYVNALSYDLPDEVVTTASLEEALRPVYQTLHIPVGQLEAITGIHERRWWPRHFKVSDGAIAAGAKALSALGLQGSDVDVLVYSGVCRDYQEPATACRIGAELGLKSDATLYDLSNACVGVLNGMIEVANRIALGQATIGMVVSCESSRDVNEDSLQKLLKNPDMNVLKGSLATFTGGSGAVAVILSRDPSLGKAHRLLGGVTRNDSAQHDLCKWGFQRLRHTVFEQIMTTDAIGVMKHGVTLGIKTWQAFLEEMEWLSDRVDKIISHQVGQTHRKTVLNALGIPFVKDYETYSYLGNMGTVSLPLTAAIADEKGFLKSQDQVGWLGIGSGLNCLMLGLEW